MTKKIPSVIFMFGMCMHIGKAETIDSELTELFKQQLDTREEVQIQQSMPVELDAGKPGLEKAVLWTIIGPTYWRNQLSIVSKQQNQWQILATVPVTGMVDGFDPAQPNGTLSVETKVQGPSDPLCCPTQTQVLYFRYRAGQLQELAPGSE
ncbi:MAG: hypothetical protein CVV06_16035 [Gammaproteobacteria bacterium HGW-Gammaproteobacteria-10]|nr:MAG: hypothetical protein CVV06_16035 [Gammaproteobacteria bacterium HGW-Gammaproteobacteria-10]